VEIQTIKMKYGTEEGIPAMGINLTSNLSKA